MQPHDLRPRRVTAAHAFFLGAVLALIALTPAIVPYGGRYVTRGDYIEQQLPFILETRRLLRSGASYSFSTFLGAPTVGSYSFYTLGSPFVWPLALLPEALIPYGISVMAVLKHAVCALCAFCYLRRMVSSGCLALLGSVLYTFSSFTVINTQFYHFTEVIAFFPLILLGMEIAMSEQPRPGLLSLACGLNALTNYYFMLSSAILAAMYFLCRLFSRDWRPARSLRRIAAAVLECALGCALAGVVLLPSLHHMLSITRTGAGDTPLLAQRYSASVLMERLRALLMPIESSVVHAYYGDAGSWCSTAAYLPVFGLTGVLAFFCARREQRWLKALLALLLACCGVPALCGAFALFTNTAYTRWWYGLALMLTLATLYALRGLAGDGERSPQPTPDPHTARAWRVSFALCTLAVLLLTVPVLLPEAALAALPERLAQIIANRRTDAYAGDVFRVLSAALALLGGGAMMLLLARRPRFAVSLALVCAVACVQYGAYIAVGDREILSGGSEAGNGVYMLEEIASPTLGALELPEPEGYTRIDYGPRLRNYGLLRGQSSLTCFSSLRSSTVGRFVSMAGFGYDESTTVRPPNGDGAIRTLLSVTEYHQTDGEDVPEGFVYDREENSFAVYVNPNAVPMGFLQTVCTGTYDQRMDSETLGAVLLAAAALDSDMLSRFGERMERLDVYAIPGWQESAARLRENACDRFETSGSGFTAHIDAKEAGLLVFTIPYDKGFSATVDGNRAEIIPCNVAFMAVWVEPGEHEIAFTYRTRSLTLGIAMSLMAAAALTVYVALCRKSRRRDA